MLAEAQNFGDEFLRISASCGTAAVDKFAFCIITPDALVREKHLEILDFLLKNGFGIVAWSTKYLRDDDVEYLYKYNVRNKIMGLKETHWHITRKGFQSDLAIGLILKTERSGAVARLRALKGVSDPLSVKKGTIRGNFKSFSKTLALIHSSDDPEGAFREAKIFFSEGELINAIKNSRLRLGAWGAREKIGLKFLAMGPNPNVSPIVATIFLQLKILSYFSRIFGPGVAKFVMQKARKWAERYSNPVDPFTLVAEKIAFDAYGASVDRLFRSKSWTSGIAALNGRSRASSSVSQSIDLLLAKQCQHLAKVGGYESLDFKLLEVSLHLRGIRHSSWEMLCVENFHFFTFANAKRTKSQIV